MLTITRPRQAGIHIRDEWEVELDAGDDPDDWPDSPARDQTLASLGPISNIRALEHSKRNRVASITIEICHSVGSVPAHSRGESRRPIIASHRRGFAGAWCVLDHGGPAATNSALYKHSCNQGQDSATFITI